MGGSYVAAMQGLLLAASVAHSGRPHLWCRIDKSSCEEDETSEPARGKSENRQPGLVVSKRTSFLMSSETRGFIYFYCDVAG